MLLYTDRSSNSFRRLGVIVGRPGLADDPAATPPLLWRVPTSPASADPHSPPSPNRQGPRRWGPGAPAPTDPVRHTCSTSRRHNGVLQAMWRDRVRGTMQVRRDGERSVGALGALLRPDPRPVRLGQHPSRGGWGPGGGVDLPRLTFLLVLDVAGLTNELFQRGKADSWSRK